MHFACVVHAISIQSRLFSTQILVFNRRSSQCTVSVFTELSVHHHPNFFHLQEIENRLVDHCVNGNVLHATFWMELHQRVEIARIRPARKFTWNLTDLIRRTKIWTILLPIEYARMLRSHLLLHSI